MIKAPGYETLITHVFRNGDQYLDSDAVFGVRSRWSPTGSSSTRQPDRRQVPGRIRLRAERRPVGSLLVIEGRSARLIRHIVMWNVRGGRRPDRRRETEKA
jgi:hypothetical protein